VILYSDPQANDKLKLAITLGYIKEYLCEDNLPLYVLTNLGLQQWMKESFFAARTKD